MIELPKYSGISFYDLETKVEGYPIPFGDGVYICNDPCALYYLDDTLMIGNVIRILPETLKLIEDNNNGGSKNKRRNTSS